jgi:hypothetical protein
MLQNNTFGVDSTRQVNWRAGKFFELRSVSPGQNEGWWDLTSESEHDSFFNTHVPRINESWLLTEPVKRAKSLINSHQNLNKLKVDWSWWEYTRVDESWRANVHENACMKLV